MPAGLSPAQLLERLRPGFGEQTSAQGATAVAELLRQVGFSALRAFPACARPAAILLTRALPLRLQVADAYKDDGDEGAFDATGLQAAGALAAMLPRQGTA